MVLKIIVLLLLAVIIYCLGSGVYYLIRDTGDSTNVVKALTWRVGLSIALFILLLLAYAMGWITPHTQLVLP